MEPSRLKLDTYHLIRISIVPYEDAEAISLGQVADFDDLNFSSEVSLQELNDPDGKNYRQGLSLSININRGVSNTFPYQIEMSMFGVFDAAGLPDERRVPLVLVNGASMLYSAMREMLLNTTLRCMHGPVMLPSVHFVQLEKDYMSKQNKEVTVEAVKA